MRNNILNTVSQVAHRGARAYLATLPITAAVIAESNNVEVRFDHDIGTGCTDGREIRLIPPPVLAVDAPQEQVERLTTLYRGLISHEVGHIRKSEIEELSKMIQKAANPELVHALTNAIEDPRMEREHGKDYRGADLDTRKLCNMLLAEGKDGPVEEAMAPRQIVTGLCNHLMRALLRDQAEYEPVAKEDERVARKVLGDALVTKVLATIATAIPRLHRPQDVVKLATRLAGVIKEEQEKQDPPQENPDGQESQQEPGETGGSTQAANGANQPASPEQKQAMKQCLEDQQAPAHKDISQIAAETIQGAIQQMVDEGKAEPGQAINQVPATGDAGGGAGGGNEKLDGFVPVNVGEVRGESAKVRTRLASLLQTQSMEESWVGRRGRHLDRHGLHRPRLGDGRIFEQRHEVETTDTALFVLIDHSGSMEGQEIVTARNAALAMALAADMLPGICMAVGTFPGFDLVQPFGTQARRRAPFYGVRAWGGTPTAQGVLWAAKHLFARPEPRRLIVVVTDGAPNDVDAARTAIDSARALGIEVHGLGIGAGSVGENIVQLFGKGEAIASVDHLAGALFRLLESTTRSASAA